MPEPAESARVGRAPVDLRARNAAWLHLRTTPPGTPDFEAALRGVVAVTGWPRPRVLAALGLPDTDAPGPAGETRP